LRKAMEEEGKDRMCLCGHWLSSHQPYRKAIDAANRSGQCKGQCPCAAFMEEDGRP
jgi:hypothetical protein